MRGLVESEPPRAHDLRATEALRISAAGAYYWHYLIRGFSYLDLVYVDCPIADRDLAQRLADTSEDSDLTVRFERVRIFLGYLAAEEKRELGIVGEFQSPFATPLLTEIRQQIEKEIGVIKEKTGALDIQDLDLLSDDEDIECQLYES